MSSTYLAVSVGRLKLFFLAVYDWKEVPIDDSLFENGFAEAANGPVYLFDKFGKANTHKDV